MASSWRQNVYELIGCTNAQWTYPGGFPRSSVYLCAELSTQLLWEGKWWTHLLKLHESNLFYVAALARFHDLNVLDEVSVIPKLAPNFPYGYSVLPD